MRGGRRKKERRAPLALDPDSAAEGDLRSVLPPRRRLPVAGCRAAPLHRFLDRRLAAAAFARREEGTHCSATGGLCHCTYVGVPASLRCWFNFLSLHLFCICWQSYSLAEPC